MDAQYRPEPDSVTLNTEAAGYTEMSDEAGNVRRYDQLSCSEYFSENATG